MRLKNPCPIKKGTISKKPPDSLFEVGQVFIFPTIRGYACRPYRLSTQDPFKADGWGALVVLEVGRAFDWFPLCALASLAVNPSKKPSLEAVQEAELIFHPQTHGAARCIPKKSDIKLMQLELLGRVSPDKSKVSHYLSKWSIYKAITCGWSISYAGFSAKFKNQLPIGLKLRSLLSNEI